MKIIFIILCFFTIKAKADTITYWHVYLNKDIIAKHNELSHHDVILKLSELDSTDTLKIQYFTCWVNSTVRNNIGIINAKDSAIESAFSVGTGTAMSLPLSKIVSYIQVMNERDFSVVYYWDSLKGWPIIFRLKFE